MRWNEVSKRETYNYKLLENVILNEIADASDALNQPNSPIPYNNFYSPEDDELGKYYRAQKRKPVITLKMLNKLKKIRASRELEFSKKTDVVELMYGQPEEEDSGGGGGGLGF